MLIHLLSVILFLYLLVRLILPLHVGGVVKALLALVLLLASQQHMLNRHLFGGLASPEVPSALLIFQGWVFITLILLVLITLGRDIFLILRGMGRLLARGMSGVARAGTRENDGQKRPAPKFSPERRAALIAIAAAVPAAYGVNRAVALPAVREREVRLARLPAALDGLRIIQVSDLHVSPLLTETWVHRVVKRINAQKPDLILFTGDSVDGLPARRADGVAPLKDLRARHGIWGCVGNHEYYGDFHAWMRVFPRLGITMLQNSHVVLNIKGSPLVVAGVTDVAAARFDLPMPDTGAAFAGAPEEAVRILLDHRPFQARANARAGADLQLSGHTHGGQIVGMDEMVKRFNDGYVRGWYDVDGMPLYVCTGAGLWNGFPVRLGVPSELPCITLRRG